MTTAVPSKAAASGKLVKRMSTWSYSGEGYVRARGLEDARNKGVDDGPRKVLRDLHPRGAGVAHAAAAARPQQLAAHAQHRPATCRARECRIGSWPADVHHEVRQNRRAVMMPCIRHIETLNEQCGLGCDTWQKLCRVQPGTCARGSSIRRQSGGSRAARASRGPGRPAGAECDRPLPRRTKACLIDPPQRPPTRLQMRIRSRLGRPRTACTQQTIQSCVH